MMKILSRSFLILFILLLATSAVYGDHYIMHYTGYVVVLTDHGSGHITLGLDGGGDGVSDLTNDYYGVSSEELQTLKDAQRDGKQVKISYHNSGAPDHHLMLDSVQVILSDDADHLLDLEDELKPMVDPGG